MPLCLRKSVAVLCITIAVFAVCVPALALGMPAEWLTPVWLYEPPAATVTIAAALAQGHEQTAALDNVLIPRGPPSRPTS